MIVFDTADIVVPQEPGEAVSVFHEILRAGWGSMTVEKAVSSLILLAVCLAAVKGTTALVRRLLGRTSMDQRGQRLAVRGVRTLLYVVAALVVLGSLGIDVTSLIALVSVFSLAVSLAVQDTLSNVAGGMVLLFSKPFSLGDYVATDDGEGEVSEITMTHTTLDTFAGQRVMLPNSKLVAGKIVNYTVRGMRRADLTVCASYGDSPEKVRAACLKAVARREDVLPDPAPQVVLTAYGESAIEYHVRFWAKTEDFWDANNAVLEDLRRAFAEEGVTMTYNHLNVHLVN